MRYALSSLIVFCLCAPTLLSRNSLPTPKPSSAKTHYDLIQQLEDDWLKAERTTDPTAIDRILSDEFVNLAPNGLAPGKAKLHENWKAHAGQAPPYTVDSSDVHIYILGDTAVTAYSKSYTAKESGNVAREDTAHVLTKEREGWKLRISRSSFHPRFSPSVRGGPTSRIFCEAWGTWAPNAEFLISRVSIC